MRVLAVASVLAASIAGCSGSEISGTALEVFGPLTPRTKGGLASQWSFTSSGQVTSSFGAVVDFTYRVEGNQLKTVYLQAGKAQEETTEEFVLSGDTLTLNPIDTQKKQ